MRSGIIWRFRRVGQDGGGRQNQKRSCRCYQNMRFHKASQNGRRRDAATFAQRCRKATKYWRGYSASKNIRPTNRSERESKFEIVVGKCGMSYARCQRARLLTLQNRLWIPTLHRVTVPHGFQNLILKKRSLHRRGIFWE